MGVLQVNEPRITESDLQFVTGVMTRLKKNYPELVPWQDSEIKVSADDPALLELGSYSIYKKLETSVVKNLKGESICQFWKYLIGIPILIKGTYWEPDVEDVLEINGGDSMFTAVQTLATELFRDRVLNMIWEHQADCLIKEEQNDPFQL